MRYGLLKQILLQIFWRLSPTKFTLPTFEYFVSDEGAYLHAISFIPKRWWIKLFFKLFFKFRTGIHAAYVSRDQAVLTLQLHFKKPVPKDHCWELFLQFANPFALRSNDLYNVWFDGMLVDRPNRK